jgi:hypothetical protein
MQHKWSDSFRKTDLSSALDNKEVETDIREGLQT